VKFEDVLKLNEQKEKRKAYLTSYFETKDTDYLIKLKEMDEI
jgi:DNA-binding phage protein